MGPYAAHGSIANGEQIEMSENKAGLCQLPHTATSTADVLLRVGRGERQKMKSALPCLLSRTGDGTDRA